MSKDKLAERFEYFFIGLIFTTLSLSIQTANFSGASNISIIAEVISWILFLVSGISGLNKLEWLPNLVLVRDRAENRKELQNKINVISKHRSEGLLAETGEFESMEKILKENQSLKEFYDAQLEKLSFRHKIKHNIQKWSFYIAFILLCFARAYDNMLKILI